MGQRPYLRAFLAAVILLVACDSRRPVGPVDDPPANDGPGSGRQPFGVVEITISGVGTPEMRASVSAPASTRPDGVSMSLSPVTGGSDDGSIQLEPLSVGTFTEGKRGIDGARYLYTTFRVRNASSDSTPYTTPRNNLTFVAVQTGGTIGATAVARLDRFDGTPADTAIARFVVPTGAVALGETMQMKSLHPDVLQVYTEDAVAAITAPAGVVNVFPYGFVVRNASSQNSRTLPASPGPNQFDGVVTFAFRLPLQADAESDPFSISMMFLAMDDDETRITESLEEHDAEAHEAVRERATALGASVTVLAGGSTSGYPSGTTQECVVRTGGPAGAATNTITSPGAYTRLAVLHQGETLDACAPAWTVGTAAVAGVRVPYHLDVHAMDRYGNTLTYIEDTVSVAATGLVSALPGPLPLTAGAASFDVLPDDYGTPTLTASGRRQKGETVLTIDGITRTWTGSTSSDWNDGSNWNVGASPASRDTVLVPSGLTTYPVIHANATVGGVQVQDGGWLDVQDFYLTVTGDVNTGQTGRISLPAGRPGRLILAGTSGRVAGTLPPIRVTGSYSMTGNVTTIAPFQGRLGKLRNARWRLRIVQSIAPLPGAP
jgi:hypothetical protein